MMELVDMRDLGSRAFRRWGSSPHARTILERKYGYDTCVPILFNKSGLAQGFLAVGHKR